MKLCVRVRRNARGGFIAACPSLPGCVSCGDTEQQARDNIEQAIRGYLASLNNFEPPQIRQVVEYAS